MVLGAEGSPAELLRLVDEHEGGQSLGQQPSPVEGQVLRSYAPATRCPGLT